MNLRDAAQMMLQSVDQMLQGGEWYCAAERAESLRAALAEPVQEQEQAEPVAWMHDCAALCTNDVELWVDRCPHCGKPRTAPTRRKPLTDEQMQSMWEADTTRGKDCESLYYFKMVARAVEQAHGIKDE